MTEIPLELLSFLETYSRFFIIGHAEPDGDCIGSQISLARFLSRIGKTVFLRSPGPFRRPEIMEYEPSFASRIEPELKTSDSAAIVLDCSTIERIGPLAQDIRGLPAAVIDHHSAGSAFGDVRYIDDTAPAVALLVLRLIERMGYTPEPDEARLILFGIATDTGFFRHLQTGTSEVFKAIARLVERGTSTREVYTMIYGNRTFESRKLLGALLARSELHFDGKLIFTYETLEETMRYGIENRDSDTLYQLLQTVAGCEIVVLLREELPEEGADGPVCSAGLRSRSDRYDVGTVSRAFGGGGHRQAAGFTKALPIETVRSELLRVFSRMLT
jgi:phosphoesterase RecJ-like protein